MRQLHGEDGSTYTRTPLDLETWPLGLAPRRNSNPITFDAFGSTSLLTIAELEYRLERCLIEVSNRAAAQSRLPNPTRTKTDRADSSSYGCNPAVFFSSTVG
ncbi:unnamed protein product [Diplocarpon coronariae]|nr:hypothetical protein JHW43_003589 [Diplocarpon mali]